MNKKLFLIATFALFAWTSNSNAQNVNIPDANFKAALVANTTINTNSDTEIQVSEATTYTGMIDVNNMNISDLTGIEAFTSLSNLNCSNNQITNLNVSSNTALVYLFCYRNQLTTLNVSANTALTLLNCDNNQLTSLSISASAPISLYCEFNQFISLDFSNTSIVLLKCGSNHLTNLNISGAVSLSTLDCLSNELTSLDVSTNSSLAYLNCMYNQLLSLNLSANISLNVLYCSFNQLTSLNLKNGSNQNLTGLIASHNINLSCIQVDNVNYMNSNWNSANNKDANCNYSSNCTSSISESNKEVSFTVYPNPNNGVFTISKRDFHNAKIEIYNTIGEKVYSSQINSDKQIIDLSEQENGFYFIQINSEKESRIQKISINK